jgi:hypothetical protein
MNTRFLPAILVMTAVSALALPAQAADPVQQRDQTQLRDQDIYGHQMMTTEERNAHRAKMRAASSAEERERIRKEHHTAMQIRAKERGITLPDEPPAGRGPGTGPGDGGMGPGGGGGRR